MKMGGCPKLLCLLGYDNEGWTQTKNIWMTVVYLLIHTWDLLYENKSNISSSKHLSISLQQNKSFTMVKINEQWLIEHPFRLSHILVTCHSLYLYKERCFAAHNNVWIESKKECIWQSAFCSLIFYSLESIVMICS